jgi:hypothetical protein
MAAAISSVRPEARPQRVGRVGRCSRQTAGGAFGAGGPGTDRVDHEAITPGRVVALERAAYCGAAAYGVRLSLTSPRANRRAASKVSAVPSA